MAVTSGSVYVGAKLPEAFQVTINQGTSSLDLSTVTAVNLEVRKPGGIEVTWDTIIDTQTITQIVCHHEYATDGNDFPKVDAGVRYHITPLLTVATGIRRALPFDVPLII